MDAILSHISAAAFWSAYGSADTDAALLRLRARGGLDSHDENAHSLEGGIGSKKEALFHSDVDGKSLTKEVLLAADGLGVVAPGERIHLLVEGLENRRPSVRVVCHSCASDMPEGSIVPVAPGLSVCSPALTFVQMASFIPSSQLIHLGMMFCGLYARSSHVRPDGAKDGRSRKLEERNPIVSAEGLRAYVESVSRLKGSRKARNAARYVIDRSRSPMESATALLLCLPRARGGYALPRPVLNAKTYVDRIDGASSRRLEADEVSATRRDESGRAYYECDLVWPSLKVVVEYHGDAAHFDERGVGRDLHKANMLSAMGYGYFALTNATLSDPRRFHEFALRLSRRMGVRQDRLPSDFAFRQAELRKQLKVDYIRRLCASS